MNERIRELKTLASLWCAENIPEQFSEETMGYGVAWEDKFAELIIQECMNVLHDNELWNRHISHALIEHFGVEE